jgi:tetratricopeptide (TPR) repeat protein
MPFRAFVSSTFLDLREHREHVIRQLRLSNFDVSAMEDWPADYQEPKEFSQARLDNCDLCVLLVAYRRGSVPDGETLSITQLEYRAALSQGIDVLPFLLKENEDWQHQWTDLDRDPELVRWRRELEQRHGANMFDRRPDSVPVAEAVASWLQRRTRDFDPEWLRHHAESLEVEFARRMLCNLDEARTRVIPTLVKWRSEGIDKEIPFAEFAGMPGRRAVLVATGGAGKTISLLSVAVDAARLACVDAAAPVPFYGRLNFFDTNTRTLERLIELLAISAGLEKEVLSRVWRNGSRRLLLLLDGFNEIPQDMRDFPRACINAIGELLQVRRHSVLLASRPDSLLDLLAGPNGAMERVELVDLDEDRIRDFLSHHGAAALYERLTQPLRDLGRNPFILWALAQTAGRSPHGELPNNRGQIYSEFVDGYLFRDREEGRVPTATRYNYALVKRPVLARLALDMTRRGVTREALDLPFLRKIGTHLQEIRAENDGVLELEPFKFMPSPPAAKSLIEEAVQNGVLRQAAGGIEFLHESVQDFFAALEIFTELELSKLRISEILAEIPITEWGLGESAVKDSGRTVLADALAMLSGLLLPSSDELVAGLLDKDPPLAAECLQGAVVVSDAVRASLIERSNSLLRSGDHVQQCLGCRCVRLGQFQTPEIVTAVAELAGSNSLPVAVEAVSAAARFEQTAARSILIQTLAKTPFSAVRMACMALLAKPGAKQTDLGLLISLVSLEDAKNVWDRATGIVGESSQLKQVAALYQAGTSVDDLVGMLMQPSEIAAASLLLIRLVYAVEAAERITEIVASTHDTTQQILLTFILATLSGVPFLMKLLRDSGDRIAIAAGAGLALRDLTIDSLTNTQVRVPFAELRHILNDKSLAVGPRVGAALALTHDAEDCRAVLDRLSDPNETRDLRTSFCEVCLMQPQANFFPYTMLESGIEQKLSDFLVERAIGDPDEDVRRVAAGALSESWQGENKLLLKLSDSAAAPEIRAAAAAALGRAGHTAAREPLMALIADPATPDELMAGALAGLAELLDESTEKVLQDMVLTGSDDLEPFVPAYVLVGARGDAALDLLERWCLDSSLALRGRRRSARALKTLSSMGEDASAKLIQIAIHADSEALRIETAWGAYAVAGSEAVVAFRSAVLDKALADSVREQAAVNLAFLDGEEAAGAISEIADSASDPFAAASAEFGRELAAEFKANKELPGLGARRPPRAFVHTKAGSWRTGLTECNAAIAAAPDAAVLYKLRATCYTQLKAFEEAISDGMKMVELEPESPDYAAALGWVYGEAGREEEALAAYREATRLQPDNADHLSSVGWYAYRTGHLQESIEASRRSSELRTDVPMVLFNLGLALVANGETQAALREYAFGKSVCGRLPPDEAESNVNGALGDLDELAGRRPDLLPAIERVQELMRQPMKSASA